ncbi:hypothetical protein ACTU44_11910 [Thalassospira sp. SM2505]
MSNATQNAHRFDPPSPDLFQAVFTTALRDYVGTYNSEGKAMTLAELAAAIGKEKSQRTVQSWRDGDSCPRGADLFAVMAVLPAGFSNRLLELAGLGGAQSLVGPGIDLHALAADTASYLAVHTNHMADGRIDHRERVVQEQKLRLMRDQIDLYFAAQGTATPEQAPMGDAAKILRMNGGA